MSYLGLLVTLLFAQNVMLYYFLGIDSVEDMKDQPSRFFMQEGLALIGVSSFSAFVIQAVHLYVLLPLGLAYLKTLSGILIILVIGKATDTMLHRFGIRLNPWRLMTNSLVFGISLLSLHGMYTLGESFIAGLAAGLGYLLALYLFDVLQEQFKREWVPRGLQGIPILLVSAGLIAMAFYAIDGALLKRIFG
jgi:electron transport complex protein RnfA